MNKDIFAHAAMSPAGPDVWLAYFSAALACVGEGEWERAAAIANQAATEEADKTDTAALALDAQGREHRGPGEGGGQFTSGHGGGGGGSTDASGGGGGTGRVSVHAEGTVDEVKRSLEAMRNAPNPQEIRPMPGTENVIAKVARINARLGTAADRIQSASTKFKDNTGWASWIAAAFSVTSFASEIFSFACEVLLGDPDIAKALGGWYERGKSALFGGRHLDNLARHQRIGRRIDGLAARARSNSRAKPSGGGPRRRS